MPPKKIDYADFLAQFELLYRDTLGFNLPSEKRDFLKNKVKDICFSTLNSTNLTKSECKFLKELIQRKDLVIQKADKGNTVVITNRENYLKGMTSLLSDNSKFIQLNIDKSKWLNYIVNLEKKLKEHFKTLDNNNKTSEDEFKNIWPTGTHPGISYENPKVRKIVNDNIPKFRPILSAIGTPVYELAKFLVPILSPLTVNDYTVKYSFSFTEEVVNFDHNLYLFHNLFESLFTNIPIDETIKIAVDDLFSNNMYQGRLSKSELSYLLKLTTSE